MYSSDDIKDCIQEWFSEALDTKEVARTYHIVVAEAEKQMEKQMEYMMDECQKGDSQN